MADTPEVVRLEVLAGGEEGGTAPVILRPPQRAKPGFCAHRRTWLDRDARRVYCRDCEAEIDPFSALEAFAREYQRHRDHIERVRADERRAAVELERVKRDLRNAKARLRRATRD